ncbi:MAG: DUF1992 domain-containing protein [Pseudomonadota bacterium]|nr:DUF1992 domain-containing protein [Pseudomonadota bacterium]
MFLLDQIAEQRIIEAMEHGEFDNLPGSGKPLQLDDDSHIPKELRVAYRLLKNAGFVPPEVGLRREIAHAEDLLASARDTRARDKAARRLNYLQMQLNLTRRDKVDLRLQEAYYQKLHARLRRDNR